MDVRCVFLSVTTDGGFANDLSAAVSVTHPSRLQCVAYISVGFAYLCSAETMGVTSQLTLLNAQKCNGPGKHADGITRSAA